MKKYKQSGKNNLYPEEIETWVYGDQPIPDWISDICKIEFIDALGNKTLKYRETNTGGLEFINTEGTGVAFILKNRNDYVCYGNKKIFTLNKTQLNLLYKEVLNKNRRG